MANVLRPLRERRARLNLTPDDLRRHHHHTTTTTTTTRHAPRRASLLAFTYDAKPAGLTVEPAPPSRTHSKKRPAAAVSPDVANPHPLTNIAATQPCGEPFRLTSVTGPSPASSCDHASLVRSIPQPSGTANLASQEKRSLRSHDGSSRLKSDLPTYFSNYDDIIAGLPEPAELVCLDTPIYLVDEPFQPKTTTTTSRTSPYQSSPPQVRKRDVSSSSRHAAISTTPLSQSSTTFQVLDYTNIIKHMHDEHGQDPLADSEYFAQHRRAERKEKQLRNIEKERAMHEKAQLERLLDGLQGPDWLKVMGITGVTDGERKEWEPKRDYFVKEVEALVDKFRVWKEEEKRVRAEKEALFAAREEEEQDMDKDMDDEGDAAETQNESSIISRGSQHRSKHHLPSSSSITMLTKLRRPTRPHGFLVPLHPPGLSNEPFHSFYSKPHLRAVALGKHRHGRNASAFGLSIPDFREQDFELPDEYFDPLFLRDNARQRRRRRREKTESDADKGKDAG